MAEEHSEGAAPSQEEPLVSAFEKLSSAMGVAGDHDWADEVDDDQGIPPAELFAGMLPPEEVKVKDEVDLLLEKLPPDCPPVLSIRNCPTIYGARQITVLFDPIEVKDIHVERLPGGGKTCFVGFFNNRDFGEALLRKPGDVGQDPGLVIGPAVEDPDFAEVHAAAPPPPPLPGNSMNNGPPRGHGAPPPKRPDFQQRPNGRGPPYEQGPPPPNRYDDRAGGYGGPRPEGRRPSFEGRDPQGAHRGPGGYGGQQPYSVPQGPPGRGPGPSQRRLTNEYPPERGNRQPRYDSEYGPSPHGFSGGGRQGPPADNHRMGRMGPQRVPPPPYHGAPGPSGGPPPHHAHYNPQMAGGPPSGGAVGGPPPPPPQGGAPLSERPRLKLQPRSVKPPGEDGNAPGISAPTKPGKPNPFGNAKPIDTASKLAELERADAAREREAKEQQGLHIHEHHKPSDPPTLGELHSKLVDP